MIMVDIYIPSVDQVYDFGIDETASVAMVIEEITAMVSQKEQCALQGDAKGLLLCDRDRQEILPQDRTLQDCGVQTGTRLLLV